MKGTVRKHIFVCLQIMIVLIIQINTVGPPMARLYPALAAGDIGECRCTMDCRCSQDSRRKGVCCCKQAKKLKLKSHCASRKQETSLRNCPCGNDSSLAFVSPELPVFLVSVKESALIETSPGIPLRRSEPPFYRERQPEPPDPPPRLC